MMHVVCRMWHTCGRYEDPLGAFGFTVEELNAVTADEVFRKVRHGAVHTGTMQSAAHRTTCGVHMRYTQ